MLRHYVGCHVLWALHHETCAAFSLNLAAGACVAATQQQVFVASCIYPRPLFALLHFRCVACGTVPGQAAHRPLPTSPFPRPHGCFMSITGCTVKSGQKLQATPRLCLSIHAAAVQRTSRASCSVPRGSSNRCNCGSSHYISSTVPTYSCLCMHDPSVRCLHMRDLTIHCQQE